MTDIELAVLKALKGRYGKRAAISRNELMNEVNLWMDQTAPVLDRAIREAIESLRQTHATGARIMSSSGWAGYWLLEDVEEFDALYQEQRHRALSIMSALRKQRDLLKRDWKWKEPEPQLKMFA